MGKGINSISKIKSYWSGIPWCQQDHVILLEDVDFVPLSKVVCILKFFNFIISLEYHL